MTPSKADPCFLFRKSGSDVPNFIILQVDDSLGNGTEAFMDDEVSKMKYECKPRKIFKAEEPIKFNGVFITRGKQNDYEMTQSKKLQVAVPTTKEKLVSVRAKIQYIAGCTRPDLAGPVQINDGKESKQSYGKNIFRNEKDRKVLQRNFCRRPQIRAARSEITSPCFVH